MSVCAIGTVGALTVVAHWIFPVSLAVLGVNGQSSMAERSTKEAWLRGEPDVTSGKVMNAHHSLKLKTWREQLQDAEQRGRTKAARRYRKKIADLEANWPEIQRRQTDA